MLPHWGYKGNSRHPRHRILGGPDSRRSEDRLPWKYFIDAHAAVEQFMQKYPRILLHVDMVQNPQYLPGLHDRNYDLYLTNLPLPEHRVPDG
jgi:hypothetical protein